jgi:hypothetical protein
MLCSLRISRVDLHMREFCVVVRRDRKDILQLYEVCRVGYLRDFYPLLERVVSISVY